MNRRNDGACNRERRAALPNTIVFIVQQLHYFLHYSMFTHTYSTTALTSTTQPLCGGSRDSFIKILITSCRPNDVGLLKRGTSA